jgi:hypothetical protein
MSRRGLELKKGGLFPSVARALIRKGFTKRIIDKLRPRLVVSGDIFEGELRGDELLSVKGLLPPEQFGERQHYAPTLGDFMEVAEKEPRAIFVVYIVPSYRSDEGVTVRGAYVPLERPDMIEFLLKKALFPPDRAYKTPEKYYYMWWD